MKFFLLVAFIALNLSFINAYVDDKCLECICEASTGCQPNSCLSGKSRQLTNCGPYKLSTKIYNQAGKGGYDFETCANSKSCASQVVNSYLSTYAVDCDGDGVLTCLDYALSYKYGPASCSNKDLYEQDDFYNNFQSTSCSRPEVIEEQADVKVEEINETAVKEDEDNDFKEEKQVQSNTYEQDKQDVNVEIKQEKKVEEIIDEVPEVIRTEHVPQQNYVETYKKVYVEEKPRKNYATQQVKTVIESPRKTVYVPQIRNVIIEAPRKFYVQPEIKNVEVPRKVVYHQQQYKTVESPVKSIPKLIKSVVEAPRKVVEAPTKVIEVPTKVIEVPTKVVEVPTKVVEVPTKVIEVPTKVIEVPTKVVEIPRKSVEIVRTVVQPQRHYYENVKTISVPKKVILPTVSKTYYQPVEQISQKNYHSYSNVEQVQNYQEPIQQVRHIVRPAKVVERVYEVNQPTKVVYHQQAYVPRVVPQNNYQVVNKVVSIPQYPEQSNIAESEGDLSVNLNTDVQHVQQNNY